MLPPARTAVETSKEAMNMAFLFVLAVLGPTLAALLQSMNFVRYNQSAIGKLEIPLLQNSKALVKASGAEKPVTKVPQSKSQSKPQTRSPASYLPAANNKGKKNTEVALPQTLPLPGVVLQALDTVDSAWDWAVERTAGAVAYSAAFIGWKVKVRKAEKAA
ncbi:uncharacterized protein SPPG_04273 [Spizellomyces punctatus DAOM BR117]|uniref:Uncharacterized protein n=1 Tax=Spizellomyces punctatus (strain DAOM BR117) TaxID=645134 RepID=A0A0L0HJA1_SPIPD|nr:uncharacterized protein SPPG_04273 [Spizellomyces punctatus DAOM BR117]KND01182.1 hypothetical protein SPPG_04273 [Spizellomyces punctatus DAOM BR117]|eukprot:XP_016609221.1 hypothetical protein SPPG_04273 [Spizellomyces punctatus DAOM BR117]